MTAEHNKAASSATDRPHVLIVSDDGDLAEFLAEGLVYGGFWASVVASGIQTLEVLRLRSFDLILIDAALSGLTATDVIRRLRHTSADGHSGPRTDVPILVVSAGDDQAPLADLLAVGADGTLVAPLELDQLVPALHEVVAEWRRRHPGRPYADEVAQRKSESMDQ
jgi:DNA-binding response OmpR family regulator